VVINFTPYTCKVEQVSFVNEIHLLTAAMKLYLLVLYPGLWSQSQSPGVGVGVGRNFRWSQSQ
jgi:hypothetical protein